MTTAPYLYPEFTTDKLYHSRYDGETNRGVNNVKNRSISACATCESLEKELESYRLRTLQLEKALAERDLQVSELTQGHRDLDKQYEELKPTQEELEQEQTARREANALLSRSAEIANLGFAVWDEIKGRDVTVSEELARIHGFTRDDYLATIDSLEKYVEYIHPDDREAYREHMLDSEAYKNNEGIDYRFVTPGGDLRHLHDRSQYIPVAEGDPTHSIVVIQDITERKLREIELREARHAADEASRSKSTFLANMSHEIRTPMNGVLAMAELLLAGELTDAQRKKVETIQQSGDMLMTILGDILDFSKIEAGKLILEDIDFDLGDLVTSVADLGKLEIRRKDLTIDVKADGLSCSSLIGDPVRLRQILANLVSNAVKFTKRGCITICVDQNEIGDGTIETRIEVADTGIGISDELIGSLFEKFSQADPSMTRQYGGTGLGLAICKSLAELMGGTIGVQSRTEGGALFWVSIPFRIAARKKSFGG